MVSTLFLNFEISSLAFVVAKFMNHFLHGTGNHPKPKPRSEKPIGFNKANCPVSYDLNLAEFMDPDVRISSVEGTKVTFAWSATLGSGLQVKIVPVVSVEGAPAVGCTSTNALNLASGTTTYT